MKNTDIIISKRNFVFLEELIPLEKEKITKIIIHHTSRDFLTAEEVHAKHINKCGWAGIGYNYFIEKNGEIVEGRGLHVGAQAYGFNQTSIGIALSGEFNIVHPTTEQMNSLIPLTKKIMQDFNVSANCIFGHKELEGHDTACPGENFDLDGFRKLMTN